MRAGDVGRLAEGFLSKNRATEQNDGGNLASRLSVGKDHTSRGRKKLKAECSVSAVSAVSKEVLSKEDGEQIEQGPQVGGWSKVRIENR